MKFGPDKNFPLYGSMVLLVLVNVTVGPINASLLWIRCCMGPFC